MRLINIATLELEEFVGDGIPPYCILSHRWIGKETTYKDFRKGYLKDSPGYQKIVRFCSVVKHDMLQYSFFWPYPYSKDRFQYVWVDTCCINKESSAELTEAINSMWSYYNNAFCCFAYLADVTECQVKTATMNAFRRSSWFSRGWTLQELLAPDLVLFFDSDWRPFGSLGTGAVLSNNASSFPDLADTVSTVSGIRKEHLSGPWHSSSIAQKMSWAAKRFTTRIEDEAYCLLGIFGVNMPLLYGEGRKAFQRLQQELVKNSNDQSIFAWSEWDEDREWDGIFARSARQFRCSSNVQLGKRCPPYELTNRGLRLTAEYANDRFPSRTVLIRLNCFIELEQPKRETQDGHESDLGLVSHRRAVKLLLQKHQEAEQWYRCDNDALGRKILGVERNACVLEDIGAYRKWQPEKTFFVDAFTSAYHGTTAKISIGAWGDHYLE